MRPATEQLDILLDGVEQVLPADEFAARVTAAARGQRPPLRVKLGVDPTSSDLHLGHTVVLGKLAQFQALGHVVVLIIGGFTAQVGDPSGRSVTRPRLSPAQVSQHAATYLAQARKVLGPQRLEIRDNSEWLAPMTMADVLGLTSQMTVARMLERADFAARYRAGKPIALSEFLYPLLQGQDSVAVHADVELGGTDQTFNLLVGRDLQAAAGQPPQCVLTLPLLEGTDGQAKMSKTAGNAIGVTDPPEEMFGKIMSIPDPLMPRWYRLLTDVGGRNVDRLSAELADGSVHPAEAKRRLAELVTARVHGQSAAAAARARFDTTFRDRAVPHDVATVDLGPQAEWFLPSLLVAAGLVDSGSAARRMVAQGAVRLDGQVLRDATATLPASELAGRVLQVGRRRMVRLRASNGAPAGADNG